MYLGHWEHNLKCTVAQSGIYALETLRLYRQSSFSYICYGNFPSTTNYPLQIKPLIITFYRCRTSTFVVTYVALQSSVRTGRWRQQDAPTGELMLLALKCSIFNLCITYHMKCKIIPVQTSTDPEGSRSLRLPDFETISKLKWLGCQRYTPQENNPGVHFC